MPLCDLHLGHVRNGSFLWRMIAKILKEEPWTPAVTPHRRSHLGGVVGLPDEGGAVAELKGLFDTDYRTIVLNL
jgi:hypothetical protein